MKSVQIVAANQIHAVWEIVWPMLNVAFLNYEDPDYGVDHLKIDIINGNQTLFVVVNNDKIIGAYTMEFINYANHRVAHITAIGGKDMITKETVKQCENWARANGATKIRAFAQETQARLFKLKMGLEKVTNVVEKNL
jgi:hypothetical protein